MGRERLSADEAGGLVHSIAVPTVGLLFSLCLQVRGQSLADLCTDQ